MKTKTHQDLVTVASFMDYIQASVAKSRLEASGIGAWLANDIIVTLDWFHSFAYGGVKLWVRESDAVAARELLGATDTQLTDEPSLEERQQLFTERIPRRLIFALMLAYQIIGWMIAGIIYSALAISGQF
jgi:hypothetical protein